VPNEFAHVALYRKGTCKDYCNA